MKTKQSILHYVAPSLVAAAMILVNYTGISQGSGAI